MEKAADFAPAPPTHHGHIRGFVEHLGPVGEFIENLETINQAGTPSTRS